MRNPPGFWRYGLADQTGKGNAGGREDWVPTNEGKAIGITSEERGEPGREYIRIIYTKPAQEFLAENLKVITEQQLNG